MERKEENKPVFVGLYPCKRVELTPEEARYSFMAGFGQVPFRQVDEVREELMKALKITSRTTWYKRLYGKIEPRVSEMQAVADVFEKYGITDVWGAGE